MKLIIISDSHDNLFSVRELVKRIKSWMPDKIVHLGDIVSPFTLRILLDTGIPFVGVFGNNDGDKVKLKEMCASIYEQPYLFTLGKHDFLLLHGFNTPEVTIRVVEALGVTNGVGLILYGHTHKHDLRAFGRTLIMNPGALSGYVSDLMTYGIMELDERGIHAEIRELITGKVIGRLDITKNSDKP